MDLPPNDNHLVDFEVPPGVDLYFLTDDDVRRQIHELLDEAGITVAQLKEEAKKDEFSSFAAEQLWFLYDYCIDEFT